MFIKIRTVYYYTALDDTVSIAIPAIIINRQIMPNNLIDNIEHIQAFTVGKKTDYSVRWLDEFDKKDYKKNRTVTIIIVDKGEFFLKLSKCQKIKLKIIWDKYWLIRNDNFLKFIFPLITLIVGIIIMYLIKQCP
jgi:hypothetical protein